MITRPIYTPALECGNVAPVFLGYANRSVWRRGGACPARPNYRHMPSRPLVLFFLTLNFQLSAEDPDSAGTVDLPGLTP